MVDGALPWAESQGFRLERPNLVKAGLGSRVQGPLWLIPDSDGLRGRWLLFSGCLSFPLAYGLPGGEVLRLGVGNIVEG